MSAAHVHISLHARSLCECSTNVSRGCGPKFSSWSFTCVVNHFFPVLTSHFVTCADLCVLCTRFELKLFTRKMSYHHKPSIAMKSASATRVRNGGDCGCPSCGTDRCRGRKEDRIPMSTAPKSQTVNHNRDNPYWKAIQASEQLQSPLERHWKDFVRKQ